MLKRILVPLDFSDPSLRALDYATELGGPRCEVVILHVLEPASYPVPGEMFGPTYDLGLVYRELERAGREQLAAVAARLRKRRIAVRPLLRVGTAYTSIVDAAKRLKVDMIVMSTHGRTGLSHAFLGSVAERVVRTALCPVLTVRGPVSRRSAGRAGQRRSSRRR